MTELRKRLVSALPVVVVLLVFVVYIRTLLPGVGYSGDTSKFQFVGKVLGTPHEPGSPTYVMLNYLFVSIFPFGTIGFRANLLSAIFSALALFVLSRSLLLLGVRHTLTAAVVAIFGFTYTLWSQSVIAEVYALSVLFVALTLHFYIRWHLLGKHRDFLLACAVYACSFGDHLIVVTLLPAIAYLVWVTRKEFFWNPRVILQVAVIIILGAAQYGYLIWRYYAHETSYLEITVPDVQTLWYYVSGGQFHANFFVDGLRGVIFVRSPFVLRLLVLEYVFLLPISVLGFVVLQHARVRNFLLLGMCGTLFFTLSYVIPDLFVYLLPVYVILALALGVGLQWIFTKTAARYAVILSCLVAILPFYFLLTNYRLADQSNSVQAKKLTEESLRVVGKNALILCPDYDYAANFWYYLFIEGFQHNNIYALYSHEGDLPLREIKPYILQGRSFYLPLQRCYLPPGLTVYYCTASQARPFDAWRSRHPQNQKMLDDYRRSYDFHTMALMSRDGFRFVRVGDELYRIEKPTR